MTTRTSPSDLDNEGPRITQETFEALLEDYRRSGRADLNQCGYPRFTDAENVEWLRRRMGGLDYRHAARVLEQIQKEVPRRGRDKRAASESRQEVIHP